MLKSLSARLTALAAVWTVALLLAGGFVLSIAVEKTVERNLDERMNSIVLALVSSVAFDTDGAAILARPIADERFAQVFSGWYWQVSDGQSVLLRSRSLWDQNLSLILPPQNDIEGNLALGTGPRNQSIRILTRQIIFPERDRPLTFAVALPTSEIRREVEPFNHLLIIALGILGVGLLIAILLQVTLGLRPLRHLRRDLDAVRTGRAEQLSPSYPGEIRPLVEAMNAVLTTNADVVRRARGHAADLAHGLKTPLSIVKTEARNLPTETYTRINEQTARMQRLIDHHLSRAATGADKYTMARTQLRPVAEEIRVGLLRLFADRNLDITLNIDGDIHFRGERGDLEEMLGNLLENACKWTKTIVRMNATEGNGFCHIRIQDDGPGLAPEKIRLATERGRRFDEREAGSGLGLSIVNELATLYGGTLTLETGESGGLSVELIIPAAE